MVRYIIYALLLSISTVLSCGAVNDSPNKTPKAAVTQDAPSVNGAPNVSITAPTQVRVGDMIIIDLSKSIGDGFDMVIIPRPPQVQVFNGGKSITTASGYETRDYLFIFSCAVDGKSDVKTHSVHVVGPDPEKQAGPGQNIVAKVRGWCQGVQSPTPRDDALKLAQSFASLSTVIESGALQSPSEIVAATKTSNRDALGDNLKYWVPLLDGLMGELKAMDKAGLLHDAQTHGTVWREVSEGLQAYAEQLTGQ